MANKVIPTTSHEVTELELADVQHVKGAQLDMRAGYSHGYPGVIVSGVIWLSAGIVALYTSPKQAIWVLFIGGTFIHTIGVLLNKVFGATGSHSSNNPLGQLAMEGTIFMLMCMPLAYVLSFQKVEWFFQAMLVIIGGRYLTFATLYGNRLYWLLGAGLGMAAYCLFALKSSAYLSIFAGAGIEIIFGLVMFIRTFKRM